MISFIATVSWVAIVFYSGFLNFTPNLVLGVTETPEQCLSLITKYSSEHPDEVVQKRDTVKIAYPTCILTTQPEEFTLQ